MPKPFPFSAIVGQDSMKRALLIAAIEPRLGGVLIFGDRGTGKSTAVRALAALLPAMEAVAGCRFHCDPEAGTALCDTCKDRLTEADAPLPREAFAVPVVDLPLGATEDRIVGALNLEKALTQGVKEFEPGLLAKAHRGFLYIDEINLLEDHLVDLLLDVAASGENVVEREGLSLRHPARFVLVGSGNPEEGELRPQLLDRFGLAVDVRTPEDLAERVDVIRRRDAFDTGPDGFADLWAPEDAKIQASVARARARLNAIDVSDAALERMAALCQALGSDGLRGELTVMRAARALAALEGAPAVSDDHIQAVAPLALGHRLRRDPLDESGSSARVSRALDELFAPA